MKRTPKHFSFLFPVTDFTAMPAVHVFDLEIHAVVYQYQDGSLAIDDDTEKVVVDVESILFDGKNITLLLATIAEEAYNILEEAARQHGIKHYDEYKEDEIENGAEASVHSEEWINAQAEQEFLNKE